MSYLEDIGKWTWDRVQERRQTRSLAAALLEKGRGALIAEVKRSSPSQGEIAPAADPATVAQRYAQGGAAAISVLTSGRDFGGSYADMAAVRQVVDVPLLCKDFFVDVWQVTEARVHGADAILVVLGLVTDELARDLGTLEIDRERQARLLSVLPPGLIRVAESGIATPAHAAAALAAGADALLVGTALMRDPELLDTLVRGVG